MPKFKSKASSISKGFKHQNHKSQEDNHEDVTSNLSPATAEKFTNVLANISHKKNSGANNWQKFLELQPLKSAGQAKSHFNKSAAKHSSFDINTRPRIKKNFLRTVVSAEKTNYASSKSESYLKPFGKPEISGSIQIQTNLNRSSSTSQSSHSSDIPNKALNRINFNKDQTKTPRCIKPLLTKQVAMDCEMVGVEVGVDKSIVARVSLVNAEGDCIYDKFVKPTEPVLDYRTSVSGVRPENLENAPDFKTVQKEVADIIANRVLVGHALKKDLKVLFLTHPRRMIRDTSKFKKFRHGITPALRKLAKKYLGVTIQEGEHSSVQDALAAMQLYRMFRKEWEASLHEKKNKKSTKIEKKLEDLTSFTSSVDV